MELDSPPKVYICIFKLFTLKIKKKQNKNEDGVHKIWTRNRIQASWFSQYLYFVGSSDFQHFEGHRPLLTTLEHC